MTKHKTTIETDSNKKISAQLQCRDFQHNAIFIASNEYADESFSSALGRK